MNVIRTVREQNPDLAELIRVELEGEPEGEGETGGEGTEEGSSAGSSAEAIVQAEPRWMAWGAGWAILGIAIGAWLYQQNDGPKFAAKPEIGVFALLYILAQSLERISEFVSYIPFIGARSEGSDKTNTQKKEAAKKLETATVAALTAIQEGDDEAAKTATTEAANAKHDKDVIRSNRAIFFLGFTTCLAALAVGHFKMSILNIVGVTNLWDIFDVGITALAIGGGTKPLHDLIQNVQKTKENNQDPAPVTS